MLISYRSACNFMFILWMLSELLFPYTALSRIMVFAFCGVVFACTMLKKFSFPFCGYVYSYIFFTVYAFIMIRLGLSINPSVSLIMVKTLCINILFLICLISYFKYLKDINEILKIFRIALTIFVFISFFGGIGSVLAGGRLTVFRAETNTVADIAAYLCIILLYDILILRKKSINTKVILLISVLLMIMTGTRSALVILFIGTYILYCFQKPRQFVYRSLFILCVLMLGIYALMNISTLYNLIGYRIETILSFLKGQEITESSFNTRNSFTTLAYRYFMEKPLTGYGLDTFKTLKGSYGVYSHSNYMELLFSLGIPGLVLYYSSFVFLIKNVIKTYSIYKNKSILVLALVIPFLVCEYIGITYYSRVFLSIICLAFTIFHFCIIESKSNDYKANNTNLERTGEIR